MSRRNRLQLSCVEEIVELGDNYCFDKLQDISLMKANTTVGRTSSLFILMFKMWKRIDLG